MEIPPLILRKEFDYHPEALALKHGMMDKTFSREEVDAWNGALSIILRLVSILEKYVAIHKPPPIGTQQCLIMGGN